MLREARRDQDVAAAFGVCAALAPIFEITENSFMSAGESSTMKLLEREPAPGDFGGWFRGLCAPHLQRDAIARDVVFDRAERFDGSEAEICSVVGRVSPLRAVMGASNGAHGVTRPTTCRSDFDVREFPKMRVDNSGGPLAHEIFAVAFDDEGIETALDDLGAFVEIWKLILQILFSCDAEFSYGADVTLWRTRRADSRSEFHEGLIEMGAGRGMMCDA